MWYRLYTFYQNFLRYNYQLLLFLVPILFEIDEISNISEGSLASYFRFPKSPIIKPFIMWMGQITIDKYFFNTSLKPTLRMRGCMDTNLLRFLFSFNHQDCDKTLWQTSVDPITKVYIKYMYTGVLSSDLRNSDIRSKQV